MRLNIKKIIITLFYILILTPLILLSGCGDDAWNNPYLAKDGQKNILYSSFSERPNHLDPATSYSSNEILFTGQIYEPPLQYHYLKRPYTLIPLVATTVPTPAFYDAAGQQLPNDAKPDEIKYSVYHIQIRSGIQYQPHPAFAKDEQGNYLYHQLTEAEIDSIYTLADFKETATRELTAKDYVYQIKRLAHPGLHSPILGSMGKYIQGLSDYAKQLEKVYQEKQQQLGRKKGVFIDLDLYPLKGVKVIDRYTYSITLKGKYPQFIYWLAMPFFAAMPKEAEQFFLQSGMKEKNLTLDWYPVGTGPYMLAENNPNRRMVLIKNPNFHGEQYPIDGDISDKENGLLADAGKPLPFINRAIYMLEKEDIPYWNKFLQGYYDVSGINSDSFDQAVQMGSDGNVGLTDEMKTKNIHLLTAVTASTYYFGFNMLDPVIGGYTEKKQKLRQAISIAIDYEEYISIFLNGRGIAAQSALSPGIFGYIEGQAGINQYVYDWYHGKPKRKPINVAKKLLADSGYPNGFDKTSGKQLILNLDSTGTGPESKSRLDWMRKQFAKLNIQLNIRATDYNRFQEKMLKGNAQMFQWGWNADYPDPENFLFLLYGPNGKARYHGENAANYQNAAFDQLFEQMKNMDSSPERLVIIEKMTEILRKDAPWIWGVHPKSFSLQHGWYRNAKPNLMANNTLKYKKIDPEVRYQNRNTWNQPILWPIGAVLLFLLFLALPGFYSYWKREYQSGMK